MSQIQNFNNYMSRTKPGYRWWVLLAATIVQTAAAFVTQGLAVLAAFMKSDLHLSGFQVGLLFTASSLIPIFTLLFIGNLLDLKSERVIVGVGALIIVLGLILASFATSYPLLLLALLVVGAGYSSIQPGGSRSVSNWFDTRELGLAMGIRQAGLPLGGALAGVVLPFCMPDGDWHYAFGVCLGIIAFGGILFFAIYRPPVSQEELVARPSLSVARVKHLLKEHWMIRIVLFGCVLVAIQYGLVVYLMLYLHDSHGVPLKSAAGVLAFAQLFGGVGRIVLAALGDRSDKPSHRLNPIWISFFAITAGLIALMALPHDVPFIALQGIAFWLGFFALGWYGPWVSYIAYVAPKDSLGLVLGLAMAINQIAIVSVPPLLGILLDKTGDYNSLWIAMLAAQGIALVLLRKVGKIERTQLATAA